MKKAVSFEIETANDHSQQIQETSQESRDKQKVNKQEANKEEENKNGCCSDVFRTQLDFVSCIKEKGVGSIIKHSYVKIKIKKLNKGLKGLKKSDMANLIIQIGLLIYFLATFIYSIVRLGIKQDPLPYKIVCNSISFIGLIINICTLTHILYKLYAKVQQKKCQVSPEPKIMLKEVAMKLEDVENLEEGPSQLSKVIELENTKDECMPEEKLDTDTIKELLKDIIKEIFIYPGIICSLYGLINEKSWQFNDALDRLHLFIFLFSLCYDALYTKFKYIWAMQKVVISLYSEPNNNWKTKLKECWLPSLFFTPHVVLLAIVHWLILAIIGVRIHVDNFSREIDQGNLTDTGNYKVASYTGYMIICGIYLPTASVIVYMIFNKIWLSDDADKNKITCEKLFYFPFDPVSCIAVIFLMVPFIAFCVGIYLPDYDSSKFEVDVYARDAAEILGAAFIIVFLICNIKATVIFTIITIAVGILIVIITLYGILVIFEPCYGSNEHEPSAHEPEKQNYQKPEQNTDPKPSIHKPEKQIHQKHEHNNEHEHTLSTHEFDRDEDDDDKDDDDKDDDDDDDDEKKKTKSNKIVV